MPVLENIIDSHQFFVHQNRDSLTIVFHPIISLLPFNFDCFLSTCYYKFHLPWEAIYNKKNYHLKTLKHNFIALLPLIYHNFYLNLVSMIFSNVLMTNKIFKNLLNYLEFEKQKQLNKKRNFDLSRKNKQGGGNSSKSIIHNWPRGDKCIG